MSDGLRSSVVSARQIELKGENRTIRRKRRRAKVPTTSSRMTKRQKCRCNLGGGEKTASSSVPREKRAEGDLYHGAKKDEIVVRGKRSGKRI